MKSRHLLFRVFAVTVLTRVLAAGSEPVPKPAPALFQRIVVLGASLGAGFDSSAPLGGPKTRQYRFANYVEAALQGMHEPVVTKASTLLFLQPQEIMERQVRETIAVQPSLVVGLDALFWFCYGRVQSDEERSARFEAGLRLLEGIKSPLLVGDIPNASSAVGRMLGRKEMPPLEVIARCNARLKEWAAGRGNVTIYPLARMMASALADEELVLAGTAWQAGTTRALLQRDQLHPSRHGLAALAVTVLEAIRASTTPPLPTTILERDLETVYRGGIARSDPSAESQTEPKK